MTKSTPSESCAGDEVLTPADLELEYKINQGTQKSMRSRGQIPFVRLGGGRLIRYRRTTIEGWFAENAEPVTAPVKHKGVDRMSD